MINDEKCFKHYANTYNSPKMKLVIGKFGLIGYAIWCILSEKLAATENLKLAMDNDTFDNLAHEFDLDVMKVIEIVSYLDFLELIFIDTFDFDEGVLYSKELEVSSDGGKTFKKISEEE